MEIAISTWLSPVNVTAQISPMLSNWFKPSLDSADDDERITLRILCLVWHWMQYHKHVNRITDIISIICSCFKRQKAILTSALYTTYFYKLLGENLCFLSGLAPDVQREPLEKYTRVKKYNLLFPKRNLRNQKLREILGSFIVLSLAEDTGEPSAILIASPPHLSLALCNCINPTVPQVILQS